MAPRARPRGWSRRGVGGALKQIASQRKLGTEWVDAFFPTVDRGKKAKTAKAPAPPADKPA